MSVSPRIKKTIPYKIFHSTRLFYFRVLTVVQLTLRKFNSENISNHLLKLSENKIYQKTIQHLFKSNLIDKFNKSYTKWLSKNTLTSKTIGRQIELQKKFNKKPKISIITPVYNTDPMWLESCINSVLKQTYSNWELCLADDKSTQENTIETLRKLAKKDKRIKVTYRKQNGHISNASNSALKLATGEFVTLLDHDDDLSPDALYEVVKLINKKPKADLIYSDEDKVELNGKHVEPFFKPDWSPDLLMSLNYISHLTTIRKSLVEKVGGFRPGFEGSQDYDLFLRITEITKNIYHIPKILYSWRKIPQSTASVYSIKSYANDASIKALTEHLERTGVKGTVKNGLVQGTFRVNYEITGNPLVSIIIPTKNKLNFIKKCVTSVLGKSTYKNYEIIITDTGSTDLEVLNWYKSLNNKKIRILNWSKNFNYSSVNNFAAKNAKGEYLILLNNDTEVIASDWIESMLQLSQRKNTGAVGSKLLYPNTSIQHVGIILGIKGGNIKRGIAGHIQKTFLDIPAGLSLYNLKDTVRNFSAVTAACLMISKKKYFEVGGMDENLQIAFNDVDFCLKLTNKGYWNVYTPYSVLFHHESVSVGTPQKGNRDIKEFSKEINLMLSRWDELLDNDPFYNKNLSLQNENMAIKD